MGFCGTQLDAPAQPAGVPFMLIEPLVGRRPAPIGVMTDLTDNVDAWTHLHLERGFGGREPWQICPFSDY